MVAEGRFAPLPPLIQFWRSLDREVPVDSILNINNMASGLHIFHLGFFLIPLIFPILYAGVVELADTRDLKSLSSNTVPVRARSPAPNQYNPNQIFLIGDGVGLFVFFEKFEDTHFRNGVVKRPESKPRGPRKPKLVKEDDHENQQKL